MDRIDPPPKNFMKNLERAKRNGNGSSTHAVTKRTGRIGTIVRGAANEISRMAFGASQQTQLALPQADVAARTREPANHPTQPPDRERPVLGLKPVPKGTDPSAWCRW